MLWPDDASKVLTLRDNSSRIGIRFGADGGLTRLTERFEPKLAWNVRDMLACQTAQNAC